MAYQSRYFRARAGKEQEGQVVSGNYQSRYFRSGAQAGAAGASGLTPAVPHARTDTEKWQRSAAGERMPGRAETAAGPGNRTLSGASGKRRLPHGALEGETARRREPAGPSWVKDVAEGLAPYAGEAAGSANAVTGSPGSRIRGRRGPGSSEELRRVVSGPGRFYTDAGDRAEGLLYRSSVQSIGATRDGRVYAEVVEPTALGRVANTVSAGVKGFLGSDANAMVTAYQAGQGGRDRENRERLEESRQVLDRAERVLAEMETAARERPGTVAESELQSQRNVVEDARRRYDAYAKVVEEQAQEGATAAAYAVADALSAGGAADLDLAKRGNRLGKFGEVLADAGASSVQTLGDAALNMAMGAPGFMGGFAMRSFGGGTQEARQEGADLGEQLLYGGLSAAKELFTEKMFNIALPFSAAYGGGAADDLVERAIRGAVDRFSSTEAGGRALGGALTFLSGAVSEGLEELVGDWLEWQLPQVYGGQPDTAAEVLENSLYDFLVGAASGAMGGLVSPSTYWYETGRDGPAAEAQEGAPAGEPGPTLPTPEGGRLTNRQAEAILADSEALDTLREQAGLVLEEGMTQSQRRQAVKEAMAAYLAEPATPAGGGEAGENALSGGTGPTEVMPTENRETSENALSGPTRPTGTIALPEGLDRAAAALGENGRRALASAYDGQSEAAPFYAGFVAAYQAGLSGRGVENVRNEYADRLDEAARFAAYAAGENDARASLERERRKARFAKSAGADSGLVYDSYVETMDARAADRINEVARRLGVRVWFVESIRGDEDFNGEIQGTDILVSSEDDSPALKILGHEWTHRMQDVAPVEYRQFRDLLGEELELQVPKILSAYGEKGVSLTYEAALDEAAANYAGQMLKDGAILDDFIARHRDNRTLLEKIRDAIRALWRKIRGGDRELSDLTRSAVDRLNAALDAAAGAVEAMETENALREEGGERFSIKQFEDGRPFVEIDIDQERFAGLTTAQMQAEAIKIINEKFKGKVIGTEYTAYVNRNSARHYAYPANRRMAETLKQDKMQASPELDNLISASVFRENVADDGRHPAATGGIDKLDTVFRVNGRVYQAEISVLVTDHGRVFYDLTKMKDITGRKTDQTQSAVETSNNALLTSIPQTDGEVKTRFSLKAPVEETEDLVALHNLNQEKLLKALALGGFPMPSIAVTKADIPHTNFGDITLVFGRETVDPKSDRRNTVYSADAWTPTFPNTEYEADEKAAGRLRNKFHELYRKYGREDLEALYPWGNYPEDQLNREGGEAAVLAKLRDSADMMKVYLLDSGKPVPEPVTTETVTRLDEDKIRQNNYIIDGLGREVIGEMRSTGDESPMAARKRWLKDHGEALEDVYRGYLRDVGGMGEAEIENVMESPSFSASALLRTVLEARRYLANGPETRTTGVDTEATQQAIREAVDPEAYREWLEALFGGIEKSSGIYNGKERYTPSGNLRSFQATHLPVTLENIAKAMVAEGKEKGDSRNVSGFYGVKSLRAGMAARFSSIADMHRLEGRLKHLTEEEAGQITDALGDRLTAVMERVYETKAHGEYDNQFMAFDQIGNILMEACRAKKVTIDSIIKAFSGTGYRIGTPLAADIRDLLFDVGEMPVNIFEAKPERAVGFDEVLAAVVPEDTGREVLDALAGKDVRVLTYKAGDEGDRLAKVNSVERAKFSLKGSEEALDYAQLEKENRRLRARVDYLRGQTRRTTPETAALRQGDVDRLAGRLLRTYDSKLKIADISGALKAAGEFALRGGDGKSELTYEALRERVEPVAREIVESALVKNDEMYRQYSDLRDYLRETKLHVPREMWGDLESAGGYDGFRRANMGRLRLSSTEGAGIDSVFQELSDRYPEFFDENRTTTPAEQLTQMADVLDGLQPVYENPHAAALDTAVSYAVNDILDGLLGEEVRQSPATYADRQARKLREEKARGREALERVRRQRDRQVRELKEHYREVRERQSARRADSKARRRLLSIARRLQNKKLPAVSRELLDQYIGDLDTAAVSMTGEKLADLTRLQAWYTEQAETDPDFIRDPRIEKDLSRLSRRQIKDLSAQEVADLTDVLLHIENELRTKNKLIDEEDRRDIYHMGEEVIRNVQASGGSRGGLGNYIATETLSPVRQLRRYTGYAQGDPLVRAARSLADGQRAMLDYQMRAERSFRRFAEDKTFSAAFSGAEARGIQITGMTAEGAKTVTISPAMRVSLYLHSLNDQNLRHIRDGGVTVPDWKLYRQGKTADAYSAGVTLKLTPSQVRSIAAGMTAQEKSFAQAVHRYFNETSREAINGVSEKLKGYSLAQVEDYFPISTDKNFNRADFDTLKFDGTIEGMGILKERQAKASNPIYLQDVNDVLARSVQQHSKYVGLAIPVRNFNKLWNMTASGVDAEGNRLAYTGGVRQAIEGAWGKSGSGYVEKLMTDIQSGGPKRGTTAKALAKLRSNYASAVLTLNASVAMKQAASYPTAAAVLGWKPLALAMKDFGKVDLDQIARYTPLQWYRSKGFSTRELGDMASSRNPNAPALDWVQGKNLPQALNWVQGADVLTTRKLWKASEYYVRDHERGLTRGSEAYYRAVADIYNRVIEETQPNYTVMQQGQMLRGGNDLVASLSMFKTQPFQNFGILCDAAGALAARAREARAGGSREALAEAKRDFGRAVTSQLAQLAVFAGMTMVWAMFRGRTDKYEDDEGEMTLGSALSALGKDMAGGALAGVPFGSDAWELLSSRVFGDDYYGMEAVTVSVLTDTISAFTGMADLLEEIVQVIGAGESVDWNGARLRLDRYLDKASKAAGVPYENVVNLFNASCRQVCVKAMGQFQGEYAYLRLTADPETESGKYFDLLFQAKKKDRKAYEAVLADMVERDLFATGSKTTEERIRSAMRARLEKTNAFVEREDEILSAVTPGLAGLEGGAAQYAEEAAKDYARVKALEALDPDYSRPDTYAWIEKADKGAGVGLDTAEYILFKTALKMAGEDGSLKQEEIIDILEEMDLSDAERGYLFGTKYTSGKNNPWG